MLGLRELRSLNAGFADLGTSTTQKKPLGKLVMTIYQQDGLLVGYLNPHGVVMTDRDQVRGWDDPAEATAFFLERRDSFAPYQLTLEPR